MEPQDLLKHMRMLLESDGDLCSMVFLGGNVMPDQEEGKDIVMIPVDEHPRTTLATVLAAIKMGMVNRPDWVCVISDTYYAIDKTVRVPWVPLEQRFKAKDSGVIEALLVEMVTASGTEWCWTQPYIKQGDDIVWDEPQDVGGPDCQALVGLLPEAMREIVGT